MSDTLIATGMVVEFHYTLTDDAGNTLDSSAGRPPLSYLHGQGNIVPGLERELVGKSVGDRFDAVVPPADGYGERTGEPQSVPRDAFPPEVPLYPGMQFLAQTPEGDTIPLWVASVEDDQVLVDPNHPLAGETLRFAIEVVSIRVATEEEISHGHPHGPGGHHH